MRKSCLIAAPMSFKQKKVRVIVAGSFVVLLIVALCSWADSILINIQVSPHVLNLNNQGEVVTVHTDIAYSLVEGSTVTLNDVEISHWKADDRGNFVAKFVMQEIKDLPLAIGELNTLTLIGQTTSDNDFEGSEDILIVDKGPKK